MSVNNAGLLARPITPDNITLDLTCAARSRLLTVTDNLNQRIEYTNTPTMTAVRKPGSSG